MVVNQLRGNCSRTAVSLEEHAELEALGLTLQIPKQRESAGTKRGAVDTSSAITTPSFYLGLDLGLLAHDEGTAGHVGAAGAAGTQRGSTDGLQQRGGGGGGGGGCRQNEHALSEYPETIEQIN